MSEILAPAGSFEALTAAVRSGADAVYFGTGNFNARRNAENFSGNSLKEAVDYCHLHGVKCHVTLNTLVSDREMNEFTETVKRTCECNADALILQDLAAAKIVREICPDIEMHASTQMSTGTLEGLKLLKKLGFKRAVLPRELSKKEIRYLAENSPIDLEVFVHGALCMCVSGQCLMSAVLGSRSGNRGLCAQPCRLPFGAENGTGHDLSLKDLSLIEELRELSDMGIVSFKIEGRMKRPEYVSAAVTACRESLDGSYSAQRKEELKALFSRQGFTRGYYDNMPGREMFGTRDKENVTSATKELLNKYSLIFAKETADRQADFRFTARLGESPVLKAECGDVTAEVKSDFVCEKAINKKLDADAVSVQLGKCGGTAFRAGKIRCDIEDGISVPLSVINSLRREAIENLSSEIIKRDRVIKDFIPEAKPDREHTKNELYLVFYKPGNMPADIKADKIFLPLGAQTNGSFGAFIPRGIFFNSREILTALENSPSEYVLCNTPDAVALALETGKKITAGPFMNIFNSISLAEYEKLGINEAVLSYELTAKEISLLSSSLKRGAVIYGRTPLMLTRNCPVRNGKTCAECKKHGVITDRLGIEFPVICGNGFSEILNSRPTYMLDRADEIKNTDFDMLVFTDESKTEIHRIINSYYSKEKPVGEFTRGLFTRGVE